MTIAMDAVYEGNGALKLEQPVGLKKLEKVRVVIQTEAEPLTLFQGEVVYRAPETIVTVAKPR